ncbi:MAG: AraC family transcriptional regulator [Mucilaginibacter sp.]
MKKSIAIRGTEALQETFKQANKVQVNIHFEHIHVQSGDEKFLRELIEYIKQNISNSKLSIERLSREMKMSRVSLYKKILMFTGKSPIEFLRLIRLQKAVELLENSQMKIGRIACEVGFDTPQYFSKLFKQEYDILPSAYINFARKAKVQAILNDYGLTSAVKIAGYGDSGMPSQKL